MESTTRVLLAEDDFNLGNILKAYLEAKGFPTTLCVNGQEALTSFMKEKYDFCIIDIMMPVKDGITFAKEVRKSDQKTPILFLTAKSMPEDILKGFQAGADDYLTKPFSMEVLLARMNAILRRTDDKKMQHKDKFVLGKYHFDYTRQLLIFEGEEQKLTSKEADLLKMLCENENDVLDRSLALNKIWHDDSYFNARSMDVYITKLRKYLRLDSSIELINVHGVGFKLVTQ